MEDKKMAADWEMDEDFYKNSDGNSSMTIEDFMEEGDCPEQELRPFGQEMSRLEQEAEKVRQVLDLAAAGNGVELIADRLDLSSEYVVQIQICAQSFPEDDELAIARLLVMG